MLHVPVVALLAVWAYVVLRGKPLRRYTPVYFLGGLIGFMAEFTFSGVFQFYSLRMHLLADPFYDVRLAAVFDKLGSIPLIAVIYAAYSAKRPILAAVVGSAMLGALEVLFLATASIEYRSWTPLLTIGFFFVFFQMVRVIFRYADQLPLWLHTDAFAFWAAFLVDVLAHGAFWLWHYELPVLGTSFRGDSRMTGLLFNGLVLAPLTTFAAVWLRSWAAAVGAAVLLLLIEMVGLSTGAVVYDGWNLWLAALRYLLAAALPLIYAKWYAGEKVRV